MHRLLPKSCVPRLTPYWDYLIRVPSNARSAWRPQVLDFEAYVGAAGGMLATNSRPLQPLGERALDFDDFA